MSLQAEDVMSPLERASLLAHARSRRFREKLARTQAFLERVLAEYRPHVSFSGGKDSTLALFLVRRVCPETPAVHFDSGGEHPLTPPHLHSFANVHVYRPRMDYIELLRMAYVSGEYIPSSELMRYIIGEPSERASSELGTDSYVIGLRKEESPGREASAKTHGPLYAPRDGGPVRIAPLLWWSAQDVWAATLAFRLPVHPAYADRFPGESLMSLRVGVVTDLSSGHAPATLSRLATFHPEQYAALKERAPEVPWPL